MVSDGRARALAALTGGLVVVLAPSLLARLTGTGVHPGEVVRAELAGSGAALMQVTGGDQQALAIHRRLTTLDNVYVAAYPVPLVLGIGLLRPPGRQVGVGLTGLAAVADLIENAALVRALDLLAAHPTQPESADSPARRARRAALVKFSALIPAAGLALWGTTCTLRPGSDHPDSHSAPSGSLSRPATAALFTESGSAPHAHRRQRRASPT